MDLVRQINLEKLPLMALHLGDEEIILARKKLKWKNEPFFIPDDILKTWREIGEKGVELEKSWQQSLK